MIELAYTGILSLFVFLGWYCYLHITPDENT